MERLTERFNNGQAAVLGCGNNCKYDYKYCHNAYEDCPTINEIYERLATYEDTKLIPEKIAEIYKLYLKKCQEVNRLNVELAEYKKQPQGDLISRSKMIEDINKHINEVKDEDVKEVYEAFIKFLTERPTTYDVEKVVEQIQRINTTWNCQKCEYSKICDDIEKCGDEHLDLCAEVVKRVSINIVRKGGKE